MLKKMIKNTRFHGMVLSAGRFFYLSFTLRNCERKPLEI